MSQVYYSLSDRVFRSFPRIAMLDGDQCPLCYVTSAAWLAVAKREMFCIRRSANMTGLNFPLI